MGIFQEVSNWVLGSYKVRTTQATDGAQYQHVRLDVGAGTAESQVTAANPLPVTVGGSGVGSATVSPQYRNNAIALDGPIPGEYLVATGETVSGASTTTTFTQAGHQARVGDTVGWFGTGFSANPNVERTVISTTLTTVTLAVACPNTIQIGDSYTLTRPTRLKTDALGNVGITGNTGGGAVSVTGNVNAETNLAYIGSNPTDFFVDGSSNGHGYIVGGGYNDDTFLADTLHLKKSDPVTLDAGLITRNIPSGTQNVSPAAPTVTGTITTATSTITLNPIAGYGGVCVSVSGTYTGVNFLLEGSRDGTNWSTISMSQQNTPAIQQATGVIASTIRQWIAPTLGCIAVRVRATAWVSGTANITINGSLAAVPTAVQTIPSGTQTVSGTVTVTGSVSLTGAKAAGGASHYRNIDLNSTGILIQTAQTYVTSIEVFNTTGATIYLKIYNKATAATSADTPIKTIPIAAGRERDINSGIGWNIALGYSVRCVTGVADADTTSPAANGCVFSTTYT
jgi:hypothetical protein